jgi:transcription termination factor Rho
LTTVSTSLVRAQGQAAAMTDERVIDIPPPSGADQRALFVAPLKPKAVIVMLPSGSGDIGLNNGGEIRHNGNFVARSERSGAP